MVSTHESGPNLEIDMTAAATRYAPDLIDDFTSHARVAALVGPQKFVLDIGCGGGFIAERLRNQGCHIIGIDRDPALLERARSFCDEVIEHDLEGDIGALNLPTAFDAVVMADVLEHLREPEALLVAAGNLLRPGGSVVLSVPNVAHVSVRLKLLFGKFDYATTGILDATHLKFFTRRSIEALLQRSGFEVRNLVAVGRFPILARLERSLMTRRFEAAAASLWPSGFAFQYVVKAVPRTQ
jgi:2-polyprenyl-3-methyl-5-hydroxy-6-metoxy-1,4-benzoquinol methylase